ncbi:MAG: DUF2059 domain-containing protein [Betaproteobacteria bacterium]|nr:DUF2059 domain-containing protein [Betaproteobacteria bacterium]
MTRIALLALLFLVLPIQAAPRDDKVRELMKAQGLMVLIEQQLEAGKEESRKQARQMSDQIFMRLKPTPEYQDKFLRAFEDFVLSLNKTWSASEMVEVWAKAYGSQFSDKELDGLLAYYRSPLGQKDVKAAQTAMPLLTQHFSQKIGPVVERETQLYMERIEKLTEACKCPR